MHYFADTLADATQILEQAYHETNQPNERRLTIRDIYRPFFDREPKRSKPTLKFCDKRIGSNGNISMLVSESGSGKSAICEAICASWLLQNLYGGQETNRDTLNLKTELEPGKKILFIDGERSREDIYDSNSRILRRAGLIDRHTKPKTFPAEIQREIDKVDLRWFAEVADLADRKRLLGDFIRTGEYGLIILDGLGDFVRDSNNLNEASEIWFFLKELIREELTLFITLHTNPKSDKARGHLGSEMMRRCESVIYIEKDKEGYRSLRPLKVRNASDKIYMDFDWDEELMMYVSTGVTDALPPSKKERSENEQIEKLDNNRELMPQGEPFGYNEMVSRLEQILDISIATAKRYLAKYQADGIIIKDKQQYFWRTTF